jgi:hypothetical protein
LDTWFISIEGNEFDLTALSAELTIAQAVIRKDNGIFGIQSSRFDSLETADDVRHEAANLVDIINGIGKLITNMRTPIRLGNVTKISADGCLEYYLKAESGVFLLEGASVSMSIGRSGFEPVEASRSIPSYADQAVSIALTDATVAKVLRLYGRANQDRTNLYRIFEIIERDVGGEAKLIDKKWQTREAIRRFQHTANSVAASGDEARHGVDKGNHQPPRDPMTFAESHAVITRLVSSWVKLKQSAGTP